MTDLIHLLFSRSSQVGFNFFPRRKNLPFQLFPLKESNFFFTKSENVFLQLFFSKRKDIVLQLTLPQEKVVHLNFSEENGYYSPSFSPGEGSLVLTFSEEDRCYHQLFSRRREDNPNFFPLRESNFFFEEEEYNPPTFLQEEEAGYF